MSFKCIRYIVLFCVLLIFFITSYFSSLLSNLLKFLCVSAYVYFNGLRVMPVEE